MDKKQKQLFTLYYKKFKERTFDEKDVSNFLILVREKVKGIRSIRELGDFIAHREKSKGLVKEYLAENERILNNLGNINAVMRIQNVFSFKEIRSGLNSLFQNEGYGKVSNEAINDIILCIISLLQGVRFLEGKDKRGLGDLSFAISSKEVLLLANIRIKNKERSIPAQFPVLSAKNLYEKLKPSDKFDTPYSFGDKVIEVINIDGKMAITFPNTTEETP